MVEARRTSSLARVDVEAHIAVADRDGAHGALHGFRGAHAEQGLIEIGEQRILLTDNGYMVNLGEHAIFPSYSAVEAPVRFMASLAAFTMSGDVLKASARMA